MPASQARPVVTVAAARVASVAFAAVLAQPAPPLEAQQQVQFYISATDASGLPITNLKPDDVLMMENGQTGEVLRLEPVRWPLKVTVLVDNGGARFGDQKPMDGTVQQGLPSYRTALRGFVEVLPADVEVEIIATAPNPRWLARSTAVRAELLKGIGQLTPDETYGRSNDAFVEYAARLESEFEATRPGRLPPYRPALLSIATTLRDGSTAMRDPLLGMLNTLVLYRTMTSIVMVSPGGAAGRDDGTHVLVAKAAQELTGGRYEAIADPGRLTTLLPEIGRQLAAVHARQTTQYRVTVERPAGASGPLTDLRLSIARNGVSYAVSADGSYAPPAVR